MKSFAFKHAAIIYVLPSLGENYIEIIKIRAALADSMLIRSVPQATKALGSSFDWFLDGKRILIIYNPLRLFE